MYIVILRDREEAVKCGKRNGMWWHNFRRYLKVFRKNCFCYCFFEIVEQMTRPSKFWNLKKCAFFIGGNSFLRWFISLFVMWKIRDIFMRRGIDLSDPNVRELKNVFISGVPMKSRRRGLISIFNPERELAQIIRNYKKFRNNPSLRQPTSTWANTFGAVAMFRSRSTPGLRYTAIILLQFHHRSSEKIVSWLATFFLFTDISDSHVLHQGSKSAPWGRRLKQIFLIFLWDHRIASWVHACNREGAAHNWRSFFKCGLPSWYTGNFSGIMGSPRTTNSWACAFNETCDLVVSLARDIWWAICET